MPDSRPRVVILGSGAHAKVVIEIIELLDKFEIMGCVSGDPNAPDSLLGYSLLGDWDCLPDLLRMGVEHAAIGVGGWTNNELRKDVFSRANSEGFRLITPVHPSVIISKSSTVGEGGSIYAGAVIQNEVSIGKNTIIATCAQIDHESTIEDHVLVSAGVKIGGKVTVGEGTLLAIGSTVVSDITIGKNALVAAGAVVVKDVPDGAKMFGVPATQPTD